MTPSPSVAAIVPTMNRAERLHGALQSAFAQTYDRLEVVVVDGGSADRTPDVVSRYRDRYGDDRVTYVRNDEPRGLPAARNQAAGLTDADLLAFLDDDDRWHPRKTERQVRQFAESDADVDLSFTGRISKTEEGEHVHTEQPSLDGDPYRRLLIRNAIGSPSRVMVTADAFESVGGFDEELRHQEDWDFYLRVARDYEIGCVPSPLVTRVYHPENMSKDVEKQKAYGERILERYRSELHAHGVYASAWAALHRDAGITHAQNGDTTAGRRELREALQYDQSVRSLLLYALAMLGPRGFQLGTRLKQALDGTRGEIAWNEAVS